MISRQDHAALAQISLAKATEALAKALARHDAAVAQHLREVPDPSEATLIELEGSYMGLVEASRAVVRAQEAVAGHASPEGEPALAA